MRVVNYSDLRLNLKKWLDIVVNDVEELIIKRKDNKDLILISLEEYNTLKETSYLLSGKNRTVLLKSIDELKEGKTTENNLIEE
ncbi:MAG: type II toxin-antitoxin system Phd/YefM family antitoxin [Flavobacteriia bacterium]|nr:type II toxin-antitoxin system Phd/YefM family antitoxin [Flavobacteriia bacterium]